MPVTEYYNEAADGLHFSREQASAFAKRIADDFNPIHDPDAKMFCVPGDLLFAVTLAKYGLSQKMHFDFAGMVGGGVTLNFQQSGDEKLQLQDDDGKTYLEVARSGEVTREQELVWQFTRRYVEFSGHNFLQVLVPMMEREGVMINPARPLVIYQSMSIDLDSLEIDNPSLELVQSQVDIEGKKAAVRMEFCLKSHGKVVGRGEKRMSMRGLRPYEAEAMEKMVNDYKGYKLAHAG